MLACVLVRVVLETELWTRVYGVSEKSTVPLSFFLFVHFFSSSSSSVTGRRTGKGRGALCPTLASCLDPQWSYCWTNPRAYRRTKPLIRAGVVVVAAAAADPWMRSSSHFCSLWPGARHARPCLLQYWICVCVLLVRELGGCMGVSHKPCGIEWPWASRGAVALDVLSQWACWPRGRES